MHAILMYGSRDVVITPFAYSDGTGELSRDGLQTACTHGGFFASNGVNGAQAEALRVPMADGTLFSSASTRTRR